MASRISNLLIHLATGGLVLMVAIIGWQVFGRFALNASPSWTEQASLVLMIWYVMLAAAAGVHEGFHIRIAIVEERLGARAALILRVTAGIVMLLGLVLLIYGTQLAWLVRNATIPSLGISRAVAYAPMPLSGLLIMLFSIPQLVRGVTPAEDRSDR